MAWVTAVVVLLSAAGSAPAAEDGPAGAIGGGFRRSLIGVILLNPIPGAAVDATAGALTGVGINDRFIKEPAAVVKPGSSALFVPVRKAPPDKLLDEVEGSGGKTIETSLPHDNEAKLQAALSAVERELFVLHASPRLAVVPSGRSLAGVPTKLLTGGRK